MVKVPENFGRNFLGDLRHPRCRGAPQEQTGISLLNVPRFHMQYWATPSVKRRLPVNSAQDFHGPLGPRFYDAVDLPTYEAIQPNHPVSVVRLGRGTLHQPFRFEPRDIRGVRDPNSCVPHVPPHLARSPAILAAWRQG
jgi:hypothetical protein